MTTTKQVDGELVVTLETEVNVSNGINVIDNYNPFKSDAKNLNFIGATISEEVDGTVTIVFTGGGGGGSTNLDTLLTPIKATITSSTGTAADIPQADLVNAGVMAVSQVVKLNAAITEVALTVTPTSSGVTLSSIDGIDNVIPVATSINAGVISPVMYGLIFDALQIVNLSVTQSETELTINISAGTDAEIPLATDTERGIITHIQKLQIDTAAQEITSPGNVPLVKTGTNYEIGDVLIPNSTPSYGVEDPLNNLTTIEYVSASLYQINQFFANSGGNRFETIVKVDLTNPLTGSQDGAQIGVCLAGAFPNPDTAHYTVETVGVFDVVSKRSDFNASEAVQFTKSEQDIICVIGSVGGSAAALDIQFVDGNNYPRFINGITPSDILVSAVIQSDLNLSTGLNPLQLAHTAGSLINKFRNSFTFGAEDELDVFFSYRDGSGGWNISTEPDYTYGPAASTGGNEWDDGTGTLSTLTPSQYKNDFILASTTNQSVMFTVCGDILYTTRSDAVEAALSGAFNMGPWADSGLYAKSVITYKGNGPIEAITQVTGGGSTGGTGKVLGPVQNEFNTLVDLDNYGIANPSWLAEYDSNNRLMVKIGFAGVLYSRNDALDWELIADEPDPEFIDYLDKLTFDPQAIEADSFDRANHTGTQLAATISDFNAAVSSNSDVTANTGKRSYPQADEDKLTDIEAEAEVNNISDVNATALTNGSETLLHTHPQTGSVERLRAIRSATLAIGTSETIIAFDPAQSAGVGLSVNAAGSVVCDVSGLYHSSFVLFINETSDPFHSGWIEINPLVTRSISGVPVVGGQMNVMPYSLFYTQLKVDETLIIPPFDLNLLAGDEIRFKAVAASGTSSIETKVSNAPTLGTVSQLAVRLTMFRVGPVS